MIINHILKKLRIEYYNYSNNSRRRLSLQELAYKVQDLESEMRNLKDINKKFQEIYDFLGVCRNTTVAVQPETKLGKCPKAKIKAKLDF